MKFFWNYYFRIIKKGGLSVGQTAAQAVIPRHAFTLVEVMVVVIMIGILSSLAYASLMELVLTNRAKEAAQTMRTFAERAIAEGKRLGKDIEIRRNGNSMEYWIDGNLAKSESLGSFSQASAKPDCKDSFNPTSTDKAISEYRIGISGISGETYFAACGARGYCAAAIKAKDNNSMIACIKRGNSANAKWEAL